MSMLHKLSALWCLTFLFYAMAGDVYYPPAFLSALSGRWTPCEGVGKHCVCQGSAANCTDKYGLTSIPKFPINITTLLFTAFNGSFEDDFFDNVTSISELYVGGSFIFLGKAKALRVLSHLRVLCLESVQVGGEYKLDVVQTLPDLQHIYFYTVNMYHMFHLLEPRRSKSKLTTLYIGRGHPNWHWPIDINLGTFQHLRYLKSLILEDTYIRYRTFLFRRLPPLQLLALRGLGLVRFPVNCMQVNSTPYFPNLRHLNIDRNNIIDVPSHTCYTNLTHLSMEHNNMESFDGDDFSQESFPELEFLSLRQAGYISAVPSMAFRNARLKKLDISSLSQNQLRFAFDAVNEGLFDACPNLQTVNFEGNDLSKLPVSKLHRMFAKLRDLRAVSFANTQFPPLTKDTLTPLTSLVELDLHHNKLGDLPDGVFDDLSQLEVLRLDDNAMTTISESTFSPGVRARLQSLNLSHNTFQCSCSLLWFRQWLLARPALFDLHNPYTRYDCHNLPGTDIISFYLNEQQCLLSQHAYIFTLICTAVLIFTLTSAVLLYRYRWHIRLALYERTGNGQANWRRQHPEHFRYDLFVCYDSEDEDWVLHRLLVRLERDWGLRLCVHLRDFVPGKNITNNIVDCLAVSKRVLAVFSRSFAESQWCNFELELCLSHVVDNHDVMVLVMLEHVPSRDMSGAMLALLKTTTYIEWGEEAQARALFWRRLTIALKDILPAARR